jgi:hypothetical protein
LNYQTGFPRTGTGIVLKGGALPQACGDRTVFTILAMFNALKRQFGDALQASDSDIIFTFFAVFLRVFGGMPICSMCLTQLTHSLTLTFSRS